MKVFVTGATGFQGGNIASTLLNANHQVVTLKRSPNTGALALPRLDIVQGGLENQEALAKAMQKAQAAVYSFPLIFDMALAKSYTENFISVAQQENVELIILNTTFHLPKEATGILAFDIKLAIRELLDKSGLKVITLAPDIYLDNLAAPWSIPVILKNKIVPYPVEATQKASWISHADLGKYVLQALARPELAGKTFPIGGTLVTGNEIAAAISSTINRELQFVSVPVNQFEQQLASGFGALAAREISNLYRYIAQNHDAFVNKDFDKTNDLFDVKPQSLAEWADSVNWSLP